MNFHQNERLVWAWLYFNSLFFFVFQRIFKLLKIGSACANQMIGIDQSQLMNEFPQITVSYSMTFRKE